MARIDDLAGLVNGSNTVYTFPAPFQAGTARLIRNGVVIRPSDPTWGYSETGNTQITLVTAPSGSDTIQGFSEQLVSVGQPNDPNGILP